MLNDEHFRLPVRDDEALACATILDFGVHRYAWSFFEKESTDVPETFRPVGSVKYASPEALIDPQSVTPRSDVWALGTMLHVLLTGVVPFDGQTLRNLADVKSNGKMPPRMMAKGASAQEDAMLTDVLGLMLNPNVFARPSATSVGDICGDALIYNLAGNLAADSDFRDLYLRKNGTVGYCFNCRHVAGRSGVMCEKCGFRDDEYNHWSYGV